VPTPTDPRDEPGEFWVDEPGWALLGTAGGGWLPFNRLTRRIRLICDDDELERVVAAMRRAGCDLLDRSALRTPDSQQAPG